MSRGAGATREAWGCDRRMAPDADNGRESFMMRFPEAEL
jgi:hypothetical protein